MMVWGALVSEADARAQEEARLYAELVRMESSYYADESAASLAMEHEFVLFPQTVYQGDAVLVRSAEPLELEWQNQRYPLQSFGTGYYALLPVPTDLKPGTYMLNGTPFEVKKKQFDTDWLTVTEDQANMWRDGERIAADQKKIDQARSTSEPEFLFAPESPFIIPVEGRLTTPYGYTRYVNGVYNGIHRAIDLAAPTGTPVKAANAGKVALAEELYLTGNSIYIDHGMNLFSQYAHLSKLNVKPGDWVEAGDIIGEVGSTGFSTGPHLHFTFWIGHTPVNPNLFFNRTPFHWVGEH